MRSARTLAVAVYVVGLALVAIFVVRPFLTKQRDIPAEVPSPPALTAIGLVEVPGHGRLCMTDVAISKETRQMRFKVGTFSKPGPALPVSVRSPGYGAAYTVPGGYPDNSGLTVPLPAPPSGRLVTVCVRNTAKYKIAFYAASDRAHSRVQPFVNGVAQGATPTLSFNEAKPASIADRAGVTAGRIAVFRGFLDHAWIVWLLAVAAGVGVPLVMAFALGASQRQLRSDSSAE